MDDTTKKDLQSAAFDRLIQHLRQRKDVQNIDLMNLTGFCRNCLGKWYLEAAEERGLDIDYDTAREKIYGMKYEEWRQRYQKPASAEQLEQMNQKKRS